MNAPLTMLLLTLLVAGGAVFAAATGGGARPGAGPVAERAVGAVVAAVPDVSAAPATAPPAPPPVVDGLDPVADGLDPELLRRFEDARAAAARDGVSLTITSGRRTVDEQQRLVDEALERYGDPVEAHRWVAPPETSSHVQGTAVDVGGTDGAAWLAEHGAAFGLCQVFANERWHYEASVEPGGTCPDLLPDASGLWR